MCVADLRKCIIEKNKRKKIITQRYKQAIVNARDKNLPFEITIDDVLRKLELQNGRCQLTGRFLTFEKNDLDSISIDQIKACGGYTFENMMLITVEMNKLKSNIPLGRFHFIIQEVANWIPKFHKTFKNIF